MWGALALLFGYFAIVILFLNMMLYIWKTHKKHKEEEYKEW